MQQNQQKFPPWKGFSCFSYHKITLFKNKYGIEVITLISMYHLNLLWACRFI